VAEHGHIGQPQRAAESERKCAVLGVRVGACVERGKGVQDEAGVGRRAPPPACSRTCGVGGGIAGVSTRPSGNSTALASWV